MESPPLVEGRGRSDGSRAILSDFDAGPPVVLPTLIAETAWKPQEFQDRVLACVDGVTLAVGGVGSGKSEAGALRLLKWALLHPRRKDGAPTKWMIVGPEFGLIRSEQFAKVLNHARRIKGLGSDGIIRRIVTGQNPKIELHNGATLVGFSGDQYARMEGVEIDGFWMDEAQRQPEDSFQTAIQRLRSSSEIRGVVTASPEDSPGWLWRVISGDESYSEFRQTLIARGVGLRVFRWTSRHNEANEGGVLDVIAAVLKAKGAAKSLQKIDGRFPGTPESPSLGVINYARAFVGRATLDPLDAIPCVLGIDIGESVDFTWLTVMSSRGVVLWMERFNAGSPGVPRDTFYEWLSAHVEEVAIVWRVRKLVLDIAKAGKPVAHYLAGRLKGRFKVEGVDTGINGRKSEIIESLNVATASARVRVPSSWKTGAHDEQRVDEVAQLRKEFEELTVKENGARRSYDHPHGGHDDGIVSLALAWRGISQDAAMRRGPTNLAGWGTVDLGARQFAT
jgi:hypothetical protein